MSGFARQVDDHPFVANAVHVPHDLGTDVEPDDRRAAIAQGLGGGAADARRAAL